MKKWTEGQDLQDQPCTPRLALALTALNSPSHIQADSPFPRSAYLLLTLTRTHTHAACQRIGLEAQDLDYSHAVDPSLSYHLEPDICMCLQCGRSDCSNLSPAPNSLQRTLTSPLDLSFHLPHSPFLHLSIQRACFQMLMGLAIL